MNPVLVESPFVVSLRKSGLVPEKELVRFLGESAGVEDLVQRLLRQGWLTEFQVQRLKEGKHKGFMIAGRYRILKPIGSGGMGQVFLAEHTHFRKRVALKILPPRFGEDKVALARFLREARAVAALNHPNIVQANDVGESEGVHFLAMEWVDGASLADLVANSGPLPLGEACEYARQAALGLAHAHAVGLVHRDIKPQNILLNREGVIKILDLGLAKFAQDQNDQLTREHNSRDILGTADYMAPEQATAGSEVTPAVDLYALGCTIYFMLVGQAPFAGKSTPQKLIAHVMQPLPRIPNVPTEFQTLLDRLTAKNPLQRHRSADELAQELAYWATPAQPQSFVLRISASPVPTAALSGPLVSVPSPSQMIPQTEVIADPFAAITEEDQPITVSTSTSSSSKSKRSSRGMRWLLLIAGVILTGVGGTLWYVLANDDPSSVTELSQSASTATVEVSKPKLEPKSDWNRLSHEEFLQAVATLPSQQKTQAVMDRLLHLNPGWELRYEEDYDHQNRLVRLKLNGTKLRYIQPLAALSDLRILEFEVYPVWMVNEELTDISPLKRLQLTELSLNRFARLSDVSPLLGMPLIRLELARTAVSDLAFLRTIPTLRKLSLHGLTLKDLKILSDLPLESLLLQGTRGCDFTPVGKITSLQHLDLSYTNVSDLSFLKHLSLLSLYLAKTNVQSLEPLRGMPLEHLIIEDALIANHGELLRSLPQLRRINWQPKQLRLQFTVPEPTEGVLFRDRFSNGQMTGWTNTDEDWRVVSEFDGKLNVCLAFPKPRHRAIVGEKYWDDYEIACWLNIRAVETKPAILARYTVESDFIGTYVLSFDPRGRRGSNLAWSIVIERNGKVNEWQNLVDGEIPMPKSNWIRVRFRVRGATLSAAISEDGEHYQYLGSVQNHELKSGAAGLTHYRKEKAAFADFAIYSLSK